MVLASVLGFCRCFDPRSQAKVILAVSGQWRGLGPCARLSVRAGPAFITKTVQDTQVFHNQRLTIASPRPVLLRLCKDLVSCLVIKILGRPGASVCLGCGRMGPGDGRWTQARHEGRALPGQAQFQCF